MDQREPRDFEVTQWTVVLAAAQANSTRAEAAMEQLCRAYWGPLAAFLLRQGYSQADAEDLTQSFFADRILTRGIFKGASPQKGKFRSWLLSSFQNFLRNEWDRRIAKKRGGGLAHLSLEQDLVTEAPGESVGNPAETAFDRAFSLTVLHWAAEQLRLRHDLSGKGELFELLRPFLPGGRGGSYAEVALRAGKSQEAIEVAVSRLRREFGAVLRAEVFRMVSNPAEAEEELRYFIELWSQPEVPL